MKIPRQLSITALGTVSVSSESCGLPKGDIDSMVD